MSKIACFLLLMISLSLPMSSWAEGQTTSDLNTQAMMSDDYITATLLIIDPASEVYSVFGHCALRLQCPSQQMDYCFTFETSTDTKGVVNFFRGTAKGGFLASQTDNYLAAYREAGRGVTEYGLNLTPMEKLELWKTVDEEIAKGFCRNYGYMHVQCTSMVICVVNRALGTRIKYNELPPALHGSFRQLMLSASERYPWSAFFWQTIMGPEGDKTDPLAHKLVPQLLPMAWSKATIGSEDRLLADGHGQRIVEGVVDTKSAWFTPFLVFTVLLIVVIMVTMGEMFWHCHWPARVIDALLLTLYTLLSLFLLWLVLFSSQEGTGWNWYLLVFNLLPLLLWMVKREWRLWICRCSFALFVLFVALTPLVPQLDWPHALLVVCMAVRLFPRIFNRHIS